MGQAGLGSHRARWHPGNHHTSCVDSLINANAGSSHNLASLFWSKRIQNNFQPDTFYFQVFRSSYLSELHKLQFYKCSGG